MDFSVQLLPEQPLGELIEAIRLADELGFRACYSADETYHKDMWVLFAAAAPRTRRLRFGPEVSGVILAGHPAAGPASRSAPGAALVPGRWPHRLPGRVLPLLRAVHRGQAGSATTAGQDRGDDRTGPSAGAVSSGPASISAPQPSAQSRPTQPRPRPRHGPRPPSTSPRWRPSSTPEMGERLSIAGTPADWIERIRADMTSPAS
jgi:Luciferase-like monooxygenase